MRARIVALALSVAAPAAVVLAIGAIAGARPKSGAAIDRCDDATNPCTVTLMNSATCCSLCGYAVVTQARAVEIDARCSKPNRHRQCHDAPCSVPPPVRAICMDGKCVAEP
ncbi:MAG TPA: hypothetical protein VFF06_04005 [Polyangia bacterium]|nr:hypothetical protein [Polyangia bacterium]